MKSRRLSTALAVAVALLALSCGDEPPPPERVKYNYTLEVGVKDTQGNVLPRVPVTVDGNTVGHTDADGKFTATLNEFEGEPITLGVIAPHGYHFAVETDSVSEILKTSNVNNQTTGVPVFLSAIAESTEKDYFIWVKTNCDSKCPRWPVLLDGEEIARTNSLGFAHFAFTNQPDETVMIEIATTGEFQPANPKYELALERNSTVYRIDQNFKDPTKPKPRRVSSSSKKKPKTDKPKETAPDPGAFLEPEKPKKTGVIDLF